jgi:hypothetical protein
LLLACPDTLPLQLAGALSGLHSLLPSIRFGDQFDFRQARKQLKCQVTIRLDTAAVDYLKNMAAELGMPYQNLINLFLRGCAETAPHHPMMQYYCSTGSCLG